MPGRIVPLRRAAQRRTATGKMFAMRYTDIQTVKRFGKRCLNAVQWPRNGPASIGLATDPPLSYAPQWKCKRMPRVSRKTENRTKESFSKTRGTSCREQAAVAMRLRFRKRSKGIHRRTPDVSTTVPTFLLRESICHGGRRRMASRDFDDL